MPPVPDPTRTDRIAEFFREPTPKRALSLTIFLLVLVLFRKLLITLVFFVVFSRLLDLSAGFLERRFKWPRFRAFALAISLFALVLGATAWLAEGRISAIIVETRATLPSRIETLRESALFASLKEHLPDSEELVQRASHYGSELAASAMELGHLVISFVIGLILAIVYFFDEEKVLAFRQKLDPDSLFGTLMRWFQHVGEAVSITVQLQAVVALCNAVLTLPVLLLIGVPHVPALMLLILVSGLIPVVGNLVSGVVLAIVSFQVRGWIGVGLFVALTFVLHKLESYYLNPRLTSRHVKLPGFVLILSLIAWEHLLGIPGLFLSFPILYVADKLRTEFGQSQPVTVAG
jgi:predicted PurR-regulated permease PerM